MAYEKVELKALNLTDFKGKPMEGFYLGFRTINTSFGESKVHSFRNKKEGKLISFYGFTMLDKCLELIEEGTLVKVTYTGTKSVKTKYGMKDVKQVDVQQDKTQRVELARMPSSVDEAEEVPVDEDDLPF